MAACPYATIIEVKDGLFSKKRSCRCMSLKNPKNLKKGDMSNVGVDWDICIKGEVSLIKGNFQKCPYYR